MGPVLWHCLWKLLPAYPADLSLQGDGCCQGRMRVLSERALKDRKSHCLWTLFSSPLPQVCMRPWHF